MAKYAICYSRLSLKEEQEESITRQNSLNTERAEKLGLAARVYEEGHGHRSGLSDKHRPVWRKAKHDFEHDPDCAALIAQDLSRLSADPVETQALFQAAFKLGKRIEVIYDPQLSAMDMDDPNSEFSLAMRSWVLRWYRKWVARQQKRAIASLKARGAVWGHAPTGLKPEGKGAQRRFVASEESYAVNGTERTFLESVEAWYRLYTSHPPVGTWIGTQQLHAQGYRWQTLKRKPVVIRPAHLAHSLKIAELYRGILPEALIDAVIAQRSTRAKRRDNGGSFKYADHLLPFYRLLTCKHCGARYAIFWQVEARNPKNIHRRPYYRHPATICDHRSVITHAETIRQLVKFLAAFESIPKRKLEQAARAALAAKAAPVRRRTRTAAERQMDLLKAQMDAAKIDSELQAQVLGQIAKAATPPPAPSLPRSLPSVERVVALMRDLPAELADPQVDPASVNRRLKEMFASVEVDGHKLKFHPYEWLAILKRNIR